MDQWVGNDRGCGILNSMCQFGEQTYNGIIYSIAIWGSLALNIVIVNVENQDNREPRTTLEVESFEHILLNIPGIKLYSKEPPALIIEPYQ